ncbi:MAG: hypothetical protein DSY89_03775 [Deltaproteobacteria bacterium]|nr:MAG: hypothetical protein DSY89_03775 [Deltaproteobacteria bacterium]
MAEDPDESAQRELKEETGLTGGIHRLLVMVIKGHRDIYDTTLTVGYGVLSYTGELITGDDVDVARFTILKGYRYSRPSGQELAG